ncbi:sushi domain protein [Cooperia oncophora]
MPRLISRTPSAICSDEARMVGKRESNLTHELTVAIAQPEDSGLLHCILPSGKRSTIRMRVEERFCPPQRNSSHLSVYLTRRNLFIGTVAQFSCPVGFKPDGYTTSVCEDDGTWSHSPPKCHGEFYTACLI